MSLLDKMRRGMEEAVGQVRQATGEVLLEQNYRRARQIEQSEGPDRGEDEIVRLLAPALGSDLKMLPDVHRLLARCFSARGERAQCMVHLESAIDQMEQRVHPTTVAWLAEEYDQTEEQYISDLLTELAEVQLQTGDAASAAQSARRAVSANDSNLAAYQALATALVKSGRIDEAEQVLYEATQKDALGLVEGWREQLGLPKAFL